MKGKHIILFIVLSFYLYDGIAQRIKRIPPEQPKLIVQIVIDQMRYDYLNRFSKYMDEKGFRRLNEEGTTFSNANYNYIFNQKGVGEATISTGAQPTAHGIVAERWYNQLKDDEILSTHDENVNPVGSQNTDERKSPQNLLATTYCDELKLSNNNKSKVFGVSLDAYTGIFSCGHAANAVYWFDEFTGNWISSDYYVDSLSSWVRDFNEKRIVDLYAQREWNLLLSTEKYDECLADDNPFEKGIKNQVIFPYDLSDFINLKKKFPEYKIIKMVPYGNLLTKDFAISLIMNEELGKDDYTDVLCIGFNVSEHAGLKFGPKSYEIQDIFLRLDKDLEHFLDFIDEYLGKENVLVVLTASHGVSDIPEYLNSVKIPAGTFNGKSAVFLLSSYLNAVYGKGKWIKSYYNQQIFLNHTLIEDSNIPIAEMQEKITQFLIQFTGIANTVSANTLQNTNFTEGIFRKMQNSYNQERSGDIIINLKPGWIEEDSDCVSTNSGYIYDTHVPLFFYGWKIKRERITDPVDMSDIAPTISTLLAISFPNYCSGKPIDHILK